MQFRIKNYDVFFKNCRFGFASPTPVFLIEPELYEVADPTPGMPCRIVTGRSVRVRFELSELDPTLEAVLNPIGQLTGLDADSFDSVGTVILELRSLRGRPETEFSKIRFPEARLVNSSRYLYDRGARRLALEFRLTAAADGTYMEIL